MIDETWLQDQKFTAVGGARVDGLQGLGSENVVFHAILPDGREIVIKVRRNCLGFHIRELPLFLTAKPEYDVDRLNQKLLRLVGNPLLDTMTREYDRLYKSLFAILHKHGPGGLIFSVMTPESTETIPFILHTPGMKRRLADIAALSEQADDLDPNDPARYLLTVNGPEFAITDSRYHLIEWAKATLAGIDRLWQVNPDLQPDTLPENPLYVWGAAVMDGFFTDDELPKVVAFLNQHFGALTKHPRVASLIAQADALAHLLAEFLEKSEVTRLVKLCALMGFIFQVIDRKGNVVADGFKLGFK